MSEREHAHELIDRLPEMQLSALVGLAPFNDDSGAQSHTRHIRGGRGKVRLGLYQAAVVAIRHCPPMKDFYIRLKARGKASKLALIAVDHRTDPCLLPMRAKTPS